MGTVFLLKYVQISNYKANLKQKQKEKLTNNCKYKCHNGAKTNCDYVVQFNKYLKYYIIRVIHVLKQPF